MKILIYLCVLATVASRHVKFTKESLLPQANTQQITNQQREMFNNHGLILKANTPTLNISEDSIVDTSGIVSIDGNTQFTHKEAQKLNQESLGTRQANVCPVGFFKVPGSVHQCFKLFTDSGRTWMASKAKCEAEGLQLAKPKDPVSLRKYMTDTYGDDRYLLWLGARGTGSNVKWDRDGTTISNSDSLWWPGDGYGRYNYPQPRSCPTSSCCLELVTKTYFLNYRPTKPYYMAQCSDNNKYALCERRCGGVFNSGNGAILHPIGGGQYANNEDCVWIIRTMSPIDIGFTSFKLETNYDYLEIRDGGSSDASLLGKFTGLNIPRSVETSGNAAYIRFTSDHSVTNLGFSFNWTPQAATTTTTPTTATTTQAVTTTPNPTTTTTAEAVTTTPTPTTTTTVQAVTTTPPPTTSTTTQACPEGLFRVANSQQCFLFIMDQTCTWLDAKKKCEDEGYSLAEPLNPLAVRAYIVNTYDPYWSTWLGAQGDGSSLVWLRSGEAISNSDPLWRSGDPGAKVTPSYKLVLGTSGWHMIHYNNTPYKSYSEDYTRYTLCERVVNN